MNRSQAEEAKSIVRNAIIRKEFTTINSFGPIKKIDDENSYVLKVSFSEKSPEDKAKLEELLNGYDYETSSGGQIRFQG